MYSIRRQALLETGEADGVEALPARYLFVLPWDLHHLGGVNEVVKGLYAEMAGSERFEPIVLVNSWQHAKVEAGSTQGRATLYFRIRPLLTSGGLLRSIVKSPLGLYRLHRLLHDQRVEVVNVHYPSLAAVNFALLKAVGLFRGKLLLSFHGVDISDAKSARGVERILWRWLLRISDRIVACSDALRANVLTLRPGLEDKVVTIHNGISPTRISKVKCSETLLADSVRYYIASIGTYEWKKGQDVLLNAFAQITADYPQLHLVMIGRSGETLAPLERALDELELRDRVHLLVDVEHEDAMAILKNATVFCIPSRIEPFGIVIIEAGYLGVPVVGSSVGGITEIITHKVDGRLVPADDAALLAKELICLLEDDAERARLSEALHARVVETFTWAKAFEKYMRLV